MRKTNPPRYCNRQSTHVRRVSSCAKFSQVYIGIYTVRIYIVSLVAYVGVGELMLVGGGGGGGGVECERGGYHKGRVPASKNRSSHAIPPRPFIYVIQLPWAPGVKTNHPLSTTTTPSVTNKRFVSPSLHSLSTIPITSLDRCRHQVGTTTCLYIYT